MLRLAGLILLMLANGGMMITKSVIDRWTIYLENTIREIEPDDDRREQVNWFFDSMDEALGNIMCCEHGMSRTLCYGPAHYYGAYVR